MGSDRFAYVTVEGEAATSAELDQFAADLGSADVPASRSQLVTKLPAATGATEGAEVDVWSTRTRSSRRAPVRQEPDVRRLRPHQAKEAY
jgi:glycerol kinase